MADVTYNIYRDGDKIAEDLTETSYTDTDLEPNTTYEYQVSAQNETGESELSETISVTTEEEPEPEPEAVSGLESTGKSENSVDLEWEE